MDWAVVLTGIDNRIIASKHNMTLVEKFIIILPVVTPDYTSSVGKNKAIFQLIACPGLCQCTIYMGMLFFLVYSEIALS